MRTILTSEEMAEADRYTIDQRGVPGIDLMEAAAKACTQVITERIGKALPIAVIAGCGNNGGDGLAIARLLLDAGYQVDTWLAMPDKTFTGDAGTNYTRLQSMGATIKPVESSFLYPGRYSLIVDALFGTGLNRGVTGKLSDLITHINHCPTPVLAVDIPSGLNGSRGSLLGEAVRATYTVTFQFAKPAHVVTPAADFCGELTIARIGIKRKPDAGYRHFLLEASDYQRPPRKGASHKGSFGTLAVIGGFSGMEGAANLCAVAALRFGVGKVRVYTNNRNRFHHDSVMVENISHYRPKYNALVIGPGLSRADESFAHIRRLNLEKDRVLWDADGIYFIKRYNPPSLGGEWVMTPHPGEAAHLLDCLAREVQQDRLGAINRLGERYPGGWVLLKGQHTLVRSPVGELFVCQPGSPALAVAGSGDVLSGMIGSLMAQGLTMRDAVLMGCLRHAMAGEHWSAHHPDYSMLAEDIITDLTRRI